MERVALYFFAVLGMAYLLITLQAGFYSGSPLPFTDLLKAILWSYPPAMVAAASAYSKSKQSAVGRSA
jgi:hypothetical protein